MQKMRQYRNKTNFPTIIYFYNIKKKTSECSYFIFRYVTLNFILETDGLRAQNVTCGPVPDLVPL